MTPRIDEARRLVKVTRAALGTVYKCPFCPHHEAVPRGRRGVGRGYGLATGGAAHSRLGAHIRAAHPEQVSTTPTKGEGDARR